MSDIVERLREKDRCRIDFSVVDTGLYAEAADAIELLRAALAWYADIETYRGHGMQDAEIIHDGGQNARRALNDQRTIRYNSPLS